MVNRKKKSSLIRFTHTGDHNHPKKKKASVHLHLMSRKNWMEREGERERSSLYKLIGASQAPT
jgi:hypothetical protein